MKKWTKALPRFFVRQLFRFQFGYSKIAGIVSIGNFVSLLLMLLDQINLFTVEWWHILIFYASVFVFSIFFVLIFERLNAWQAERYLTFKISQAEVLKLQHQNLALTILELTNMSDEERQKLRLKLNQELFQEKVKEPKKKLNEELIEKE